MTDKKKLDVREVEEMVTARTTTVEVQEWAEEDGMIIIMTVEEPPEEAEMPTHKMPLLEDVEKVE